MWSLVEKNPKKIGMLEKHNTKIKFMKIKNKIKNNFFLNLSGEHIACYMIHSNQNKTK
jgi:hypothetical protein